MKTKVILKILWGALFLLHSTHAFADISFQTDPKMQVLLELVTTFKEELKTDLVFTNLVENSFESLEKNEINQQEFINILFPHITSKAEEMNESGLAFLSTHGYEWSDYSSSDFSLLLSNSTYGSSGNTGGGSISRLPCTERVEAWAVAAFAIFETGLYLGAETYGISIAAGAIITGVIFIMIDAIYCDCMLSTYGIGC